MSQSSKKTPAIRITLRCALVAATLTAAFALAAIAIPPAARALFLHRFGETVSPYSIHRLVLEGRRLPEAREFLDRQLAKETKNPLYLALRGRVETEAKSPEAGYAYFVGLLEKQPLLEETEPLVEFARAAALCGRWDDCFALCEILHDYGETDAIRDLFTDLAAHGHAVEPEYATPPGLRFYAFTEMDKSLGPLRFDPSKSSAASQFEMWKIERNMRLDAVTTGTLSLAEIAAQRPSDLRAQYLRVGYEKTASSRAAQSAQTQLPSKTLLLGPDAFICAGKPVAGGVWQLNGRYEANLPGAETAVWFVARCEALFRVYPLVIIELDDEILVRYLPFQVPFPELLQRRDGKPFSRIAVTFVNDLEDKPLKQDRNIFFQGIYRAVAQ